MKLVSETTKSRYRIVDRMDRFSKMLECNWGVERRYRPEVLWFSWFGLFDRVEIEWEAQWFPVKVVTDADT